MNSAINFVELENRTVSATYRNLMIKATVVLVDKASGQPLAEPVTTIVFALARRYAADQAAGFDGARDLFSSGLQCPWRKAGAQRRL